MSGKELCKEEKQEVFNEFSILTKQTNYFAFDARHLLTDQEVDMMHACAMLTASVYDSMKKRYKIK